MTDIALQILNTTFGYDQFRGNQQAIIDEVIKGRDAMVLMPTGGGKSLCYQIPALVRPGVGIVISPLIALMQDQVDALTQLGIKASFLNSSLSHEDQRQVENALYNNAIDLLYIAPERLTQASCLQLLQQINIALFAIDEAHCVSQWGHDFRADYLQLSLLHEQFPAIPRIALTATADERTRQEIISRLQLENACQFISGFDRPNIQYRITQKKNAKQQLLQFLRREHENDAGIIYCLSRKKVELTAEWLSTQGFNVAPYHAGLSVEIRQQNQRRFLREDNMIIVATIAFGMGIDKPDVRFIAHLDLPKSLEAYYQETGRAGRDGQPATAWMVYGLQDVIKLRQMLESNDGNEQHKRAERHKLDAMLGLCEITSCRRHALLHYFGEQSPEHCGNCDACLNPVETWDGSLAAQKALSCVYRTGQRFGVSHLIDVLSGADTEKIQQHSHNTISTYGIGKELDATQWRSVYRQLVARGYLTVDISGFGGLQLTEKSRPLLRSEITISLRRDSKENIQKTTRNKHSIKDEDKILWEALRDCRKRLAEEHNVPPYVIFHDATLMEMLHYRPETPQQLLDISGVGKSKLERFGDAFLDVLNTHTNIGDKNNNEAHEIDALFQAGMNVPQIAKQRQLKENSIYNHFAKRIAAGDIILADVIQISNDELSQIEDALLSQDDITADNYNYQTAKEQLSNDYPLGILRCIRAAIIRES